MTKMLQRLQRTGKVTRTTRFVSVALREPEKGLVHSVDVDRPPPREALAVLFDNADKTFTMTRAKLKAASMFAAKHVPDSTKMLGKLIRDRAGYALELSFVP